MDTVVRQTRRLGDFPYPHQAAFLLDNPVRRALADPAGSVGRLGLTGGEHVVELGPGNGVYSVEVAERLTTGRLELFDIQPQMLEKVRRRLDGLGFRNAGFHSGDAGAGLPFADKTFDIAILASVIGEVPDKPACIRALARVLKPGGTLAFFESFPDPDRLGAAELTALAEPEGFEFRDVSGNRWHDTIRFTRVE
ncbi:class I SAM-dependent methyltransferase [Nocardia nova]|uniref:class I SAM-dependent methyltransferase n=1 Tax=Nocardia nova TaxID=37330 RepID=UPI0033E5D850